MRFHRTLTTAAAAAVLATPLLAASLPASTARQAPGAPARAGHSRGQPAAQTPALPAPPRPPRRHPRLPHGYRPPTALTHKKHGARRAGRPSAAAAPARAKTWGGPGTATTLVLYDTTNSWGYLGQLYAIAAGNLASHFGKVTAEPVASYVAGQVNSYTATIYIGSTYDEPLPVAFLNDVLSTKHRVIWAADNVWQLTGTEGSSADTAFMAKYGWDPSQSYFDTTDNPVTISYKGQTFTRSASNGADILAPDVTSPAAVTVLGTANCTDSGGSPANCAPIAQTAGPSFPWAIRSANLTYVGEVPFSYISETDRYVAFSDLLFPALAPAATPSHLALVRLEDVDPTADPATLRQFADYLYSQHVPFSVGVIPEYTDPNGYYNGGKKQTITLAQEPALVAALKYMQSKGGTIIEHGYTHQYSNVANPYDGVTADDAEFYRAQCSATRQPPYTFDVPCPNTDWVIWTGPLPGDSAAWAAGRATAGRRLFSQAGLSQPVIWETPHYFASAADYTGIDTVYAVRYEREIFPSGLLSGSADYTHILGQFFPYVVHDVYGEKVIPENLGNYEPVEENNNPPRLPADIIRNARVNLAVTQGVASFFFHPTYPLSELQQIVAGIKGLGYTFVSPAGLPG
jgi:uncharacterized protein YdaL